MESEQKTEAAVVAEVKPQRELNNSSWRKMERDGEEVKSSIFHVR